MTIAEAEQTEPYLNVQGGYSSWKERREQLTKKYGPTPEFHRPAPRIAALTILVAALKDARPYVQGQYDQIEIHDPALTSRTSVFPEHIDAALAKGGGPVMSTMRPPFTPSRTFAVEEKTS